MNIFFSTLKILRLFYSFRIFAKNIGKKLIVKILRNFYNLFTLWLFLRIYFYGHLKNFNCWKLRLNCFEKILNFAMKKNQRILISLEDRKKLNQKLHSKRFYDFKVIQN